MEKNKKINLVKAYILGFLTSVILILTVYEIVKMLDLIGLHTFFIYVIISLVFVSTHSYTVRVFTLTKLGKKFTVKDIINSINYKNVKTDNDKTKIEQNFQNFQRDRINILLKRKINRERRIDDLVTDEIFKGMITVSILLILSIFIQGGISTFIIINSFDNTNILINYSYIYITMMIINNLFDYYIRDNIDKIVASKNKHFKDFNDDCKEKII